MNSKNWERFTQRARRVLSLAQEEAERLNHSYIGSEHVLIGLLREDGGVAGRVLRELGLDTVRVQAMDNTVLDQQRINGADLFGKRIYRIEARDDRLLMGDGHAQPPDPGRPKTVKRRSDILNRKRHIHLVEAKFFK